MSSKGATSSKSVYRRPRRGDATREQIIRAARDLLRESGYESTTTRTVAERAQVQLSLVHYHFGGKRQLLAAVLEHENERLLARQQMLFARPEPLSVKWRTACSYLREDLRSGYVRILWELWAAGLADEELRDRWRKALGGWRNLLEGVFTTWAAGPGIHLPLPPRVLATLVVNVFEGAEAELLAGVSEREAPHFEALEACAALIEQVERSAD